MATKAEIVSKLALRRLRRFYLPNLTRAQIRMAMQGASNSEWDQIINGVQSGRVADIGKVVTERTIGYLTSLAETEVDDWLDDNQLSLAQINELIG